MPAFTDNLIKLTATNEAFAVEAAKALVHYQGAISTAVDVSTGIERIVTDFGTVILDAVNGSDGEGDTGQSDKFQGISNESYNKYNPDGKQEVRIAPIVQQSTTLAAQQAQFATGFAGDVADQKEFYESLLARVEKMSGMAMEEANWYKDKEWRDELAANMKATMQLIAQMQTLNTQLIE